MNQPSNDDELKENLRHLIKWAWFGDADAWMNYIDIANDSGCRQGFHDRDGAAEIEYEKWGGDDTAESWREEFESWGDFLASELCLAAELGLLDARDGTGALVTDADEIDPMSAEYRPRATDT